MKALAIDHVAIRVTDLARAAKFYEDVLGCALERHRPELGMTQLRVGRSLIDLIAVDGVLGKAGGSSPTSDSRNLDHLCLRVADFRPSQVVEELVAAGVEVSTTGLRYGSTGEAVSIYARDPDGNGLEFRS